MDKNPEKASRFKGALMLSIVIMDAEETFYKTESMTESEYQLKEYMEFKNYSLQIRVKEIQNVSTNDEYRLRVDWGGD